MNELTAKIHSFESFGALDGPGIRFVVFFQGCLLRCAFCHNPDSWDLSARPTEMTVDQLVGKILQYQNFIESGGVTFSGGEPLLQAEFCTEAIRRLAHHHIGVALDTSGAVPLAQSKPALDRCELVLLDIKAADPGLCRELTGQDNRSALETLAYLEQIGKPVWIRHVLVPGLTLERQPLEDLARLLAPYQCIRLVELLPFHQLGSYKWKELGLFYPLEGLETPSTEQLRLASGIFSAHGLPVHRDQRVNPE